MREPERLERYRTLRNWSVGLGLVALVLGLLLVSAAIPLLAASFALIIVGALLHGLSRRKHGEI